MDDDEDAGGDDLDQEDRGGEFLFKELLLCTQAVGEVKDF